MIQGFEAGSDFERCGQSEIIEPIDSSPSDVVNGDDLLRVEAAQEKLLSGFRQLGSIIVANCRDQYQRHEQK